MADVNEGRDYKSNEIEKGDCEKNEERPWELVVIMSEMVTEIE